MGSNSNLQEFGLQEWWCPPPTPPYMVCPEELPSAQITVTFYANLTDSQYKNVKKALRCYDLHNLSRDVQARNVIHVTGYDRAVLEGQQVLGIFQKYDAQARRM